MLLLLRRVVLEQAAVERTRIPTSAPIRSTAAELLTRSLPPEVVGPSWLGYAARGAGDGGYAFSQEPASGPVVTPRSQPARRTRGPRSAGRPRSPRRAPRPPSSACPRSAPGRPAGEPSPDPARPPAPRGATGSGSAHGSAGSSSGRGRRA